jgi:DNA-binding transcriptional MerR regulator
MTTNSEVVGVVEAARRLGIHPESLRRAERLGRLPQPTREPLSRTRTYTRADIERLKALLSSR